MENHGNRRRKGGESAELWPLWAESESQILDVAWVRKRNTERGTSLIINQNEKQNGKSRDMCMVSKCTKMDYPLSRSETTMVMHGNHNNHTAAV